MGPGQATLSRRAAGEHRHSRSRARRHRAPRNVDDAHGARHRRQYGICGPRRGQSPLPDSRRRYRAEDEGPHRRGRQAPHGPHQRRARRRITRSARRSRGAWGASSSPPSIASRFRSPAATRSSSAATGSTTSSTTARSATSSPGPIRKPRARRSIAHGERARDTGQPHRRRRPGRVGGAAHAAHRVAPVDSVVALTVRGRPG